MKCLAALVAGLSLGLAAPVAAQGSFGVLGGLTSSKVTLEGGGASLSFGSRTGFAAGLSLVHPLSSALDLEIDALYVQKGMSIEEEGVTAKLNLNYIEMPVLLRYGIGYGSSVQPFLLAGAAVAFKAGCSVSGENDGIAVDADCEDLLDAEQESLDIGIAFGGGLQFNRFSLQARYTLGMMSIGNDDDITAKNRTWYFLAGFAF